MINHGTTRSTAKRDEIEICETKVFVASDITEVNEEGADEQEGFVGFEYDMVEYGKDEYIQLQAEKNATLEESLTQTQVAVAEVYEMLA